MRVTGVYNMASVMKTAPDDLLCRTRQDFQKLFSEAKHLDWFVVSLVSSSRIILIALRTNITLHAHENNQKYSFLEHLDQNGTIKDLYSEFSQQLLAKAAALQDRSIEIRFIYTEDIVVSR